MGSACQAWVSYSEKISIKLQILKQSVNYNHMLKQPIIITITATESQLNTVT